MVLRLLLPILLAASLLAAPVRAASKPDILDYTVSPERDAHGLVALDVTLKFAADAVGPTRLELPDQAAGASELRRQTLQELIVPDGLIPERLRACEAEVSGR